MAKKIPILSSVADYSTLFGGALLFGMALFIGVEVLIRKFFSITTGGAEEFSSYTLAIVSTWSFAYALLEKAHIRIDVLYNKLRASVQRSLDIVALVSLAAFTLPMTYFSFFVVQTSLARGSKANTPLQTPLWIPQVLWFAGLVFFSVVVVTILLITIFHLSRKQFLQAWEFSGCPLLEEDIEEESGISVPGVPERSENR